MAEEGTACGIVGIVRVANHILILYIEEDCKAARDWLVMLLELMSRKWPRKGQLVVLWALYIEQIIF